MRDLWMDMPAEMRSMMETFPERTRTHKGVQLCEVMSLETGRVTPEYWIVALANSGETMLVLHCGEAKAIEIATSFANLRDWTRLGEWVGIELMPEQVEMITRYPGEAVAPLLRDADWEDVIPYGPH